MYTESYLGDVDSILSAMAIASKPREAVYSIRNVGNRVDQYGLTKQTRLTMAAHLLAGIQELNGFYRPMVFDLGDYGRITVHDTKQAINFYHKLTGESIFGGKVKKGRP